MSYCFFRKVDLSFDDAVLRLTASLKERGFGILTEIDVKETLKAKLGIEFGNYRILGACNPEFAHKILMIEPKIGVLLPCSTIVRELAEGGVEIAAVNPVESILTVENESLVEIADEIAGLLADAINAV